MRIQTFRAPYIRSGVYHIINACIHRLYQLELLSTNVLFCIKLRLLEHIDLSLCQWMLVNGKNCVTLRGARTCWMNTCVLFNLYRTSYAATTQIKLSKGVEMESHMHSEFNYRPTVPVWILSMNDFNIVCQLISHKLCSIKSGLNFERYLATTSKLWKWWEQRQPICPASAILRFYRI